MMGAVGYCFPALFNPPPTSRVTPGWLKWRAEEDLLGRADCMMARDNPFRTECLLQVRYRLEGITWDALRDSYDLVTKQSETPAKVATACLPQNDPLDIITRIADSRT